MWLSEADADLLASILDYINRVESHIDRFGDSYASYVGNIAFQDSTILCVIQIGEKSKRLSEEFKARYPEIKWRELAGMRDKLVHNYAVFDPEIGWDAIKNHLPQLKGVCLQELDEHEAD